MNNKRRDGDWVSGFRIGFFGWSGLLVMGLAAGILDPWFWVTGR